MDTGRWDKKPGVRSVLARMEPAGLARMRLEWDAGYDYDDDANGQHNPSKGIGKGNKGLVKKKDEERQTC